MRTIILAAGMLLLASSAFAQSPVTLSPDGQFAIVQKNVGTQRWAIVQDRNNRSITGNIFNPEGGAQFVFCRHLGGINYDCLGSNGCTQEPCQWSFIAQVALPDTFFSVDGRPAPTPLATPRPTPRPTNQPTPRPASGLQGLIGTWDFTFRIISSFTYRYRFRQVQQSPVGNYNILLGRDSQNDLVITARVQDLDPGNPSPYEYFTLESDSFLCEAYMFDHTAADRVVGLHASVTVSGGECASVLFGTDPMTGVRVSRTASIPNSENSVAVSRASKRQKRTVRAEWRDLGATAGAAEADGLQRLLDAAHGLGMRAQ